MASDGSNDGAHRAYRFDVKFEDFFHVAWQLKHKQVAAPSVSKVGDEHDDARSRGDQSQPRRRLFVVGLGMNLLDLFHNVLAFLLADVSVVTRCVGDEGGHNDDPEDTEATVQVENALNGEIGPSGQARSPLDIYSYNLSYLAIRREWRGRKRTRIR